MDFEEHLNIKYDCQINLIPNLNWLPWIGQNYELTRTIIVGESHYDDGDSWQENNMNVTKIILSKHLSGNNVKIYNNTEKVLLYSNKPSREEANHLWKSVTYWNLVQRLMTSIKDRPSSSDFDNGWKVFFDLINIIKPKTCIVLGKSSCGRLGYYLNNNETEWERNISEFYSQDKVINLSKNNYKIKLIFINHPSGSRGFNHEYWANLIQNNEPDLRNLLSHP